MFFKVGRKKIKICPRTQKIKIDNSYLPFGNVQRQKKAASRDKLFILLFFLFEIPFLSFFRFHGRETVRSIAVLYIITSIFHGSETFFPSWYFIFSLFYYPRDTHQKNPGSDLLFKLFVCWASRLYPMIESNWGLYTVPSCSVPPQLFECNPICKVYTIIIFPLRRETHTASDFHGISIETESPLWWFSPSIIFYFFIFSKLGKLRESEGNIFSHFQWKQNRASCCWCWYLAVWKLCRCWK